MILYIIDMSIVSILFICLGLSMDNMVVAAALGCGQKDGKLHITATAALFTLAGALALIIGWLGGTHLDNVIHGWDHYVAFAILAYIGGKMMLSAFGQNSPHNAAGHKTTPLHETLLMAVATNIDVLAIGISISLFSVNFYTVLGILVVCIFLATIIGFVLRSSLGRRLGRKMEFLGGAVLVFLGIKLLLEGFLG
ncbi:MAG: manganese efflux pump MntP family protein [Elusimicrobiota bacterium]|jgi:putative Mn2+ efflux pump MntP|nr:manganese efflux pump MntP family protein [Elusimicrobiota bacterium]